MIPDLSVEIVGIRMKSPVMNAAGTFELDIAKDFMDISKLGAYVQKSITWDVRAGNPQPRMCEVVAGVINCIGLENLGTEIFVEARLPAIYEIAKVIQIPIILSLAGETIEEFLKIAIYLEKKSEGRISGLEVNISCPNVEKGLVFGTDADSTFDLVKNLKSKVILPLIVKLTPNVTNIGLIAKAVVAAGADAISLINTVKTLARIGRGPGAGRWIEGGLSGPAIKPIALKKVAEVIEVVNVPVIGMGGICDADDALDFFRLGVSAVAVGTATFRDPSAMINIIDGLEQYLTERGYANIAELKEKEGR